VTVFAATILFDEAVERFAMRNLRVAADALGS